MRKPGRFHLCGQFMHKLHMSLSGLDRQQKMMIKQLRESVALHKNRIQILRKTVRYTCSCYKEIGFTVSG